jgi:vacuolar-type H+-ATPase subunit I/STV1
MATCGTWFGRNKRESGKLFVRHQANKNSGGAIAETEVHEFLKRPGEPPEKQALLSVADEYGITEQPVSLDGRRGMFAQKQTELRRLLADVQANEQALREKQAELEAQMLSAAASTWEEATEKARYLLSLFAASVSAEDPRRQKLITAVLEDFDRLSNVQK